MQTHYDFSKTTTENLLAKWRFHDGDTGCMSIEQECRRMHLLDVIGEELRRRGVTLPA